MTGREMPGNDVRWPAQPRGEWYDLRDAEETRRRFPRRAARFA